MYLLLRNNKQSGPYSLDDLKSMGLKPYDLVWLEGKSAAWRYPSEIDELSPFAPAVEEQPFDRFYKKPSSATAAASQDTTTSTYASGPVVETSISAEPARMPGKRIIYVTMPAGRAPVPLRETVTTATNTAISALPPAASAPIASAVPASAPTRPPAPVAAIPDYAIEPLEKMSAGAGYLPRRKQRPAPAIARYLLVGVTILALLAAGIFIGLSLNKNSLGIQSKVVAKIPPVDNSRSIVHTTAQQLPAAMPPAVARNKADSPAVIVNPPIDTRTASAATHADHRANANRSSAVKQKDRPSQPLSGARLVPIDKDSVANELPVAHREAIHRSDAPGQTDPAGSDREAVRTALASQVVVGSNSYSVGAFGGINNLQLTVTNRSTYPLDLVIVEVQYVQANKKIFKTENLYFHSIGAGSALMQEAPKSARGVKVQYRITAISSKELGLSYSGI